MRYEGKAFEEQNVILDDNEYVRCTFTNCIMRFSGGAIRLDDFRSKGCTLEVVGAFDPADGRLQAIAEALTGEGHGSFAAPPINE